MQKQESSIQYTTREFDLTLPRNQKELPIQLMLAREYKKPDILICFQALEDKGFGIFDRGTQGRSNAAKFIPGTNCPTFYVVKSETKKRGKKKKLIEEN